MKTVTLLSLITLTTALAGETSLQSTPPVVVKTFPVAGAVGVDPATTEVRVTFSKPMLDRSWSWCAWNKGDEITSASDPRYLPDGRTCVLPVKLEPGKLYGTWLNSESFHNFQDRDGHPAIPYLLTFQTAKAGAAAGGGASREATSIADPARAVALFNDIEDLSHESQAAFAATNLPAAQTVTRRLLTLLTNFNAAVRGSDCEFPASVFEDVARVKWALDAGSWEQARDLAQPKDDYRARFREIAAKMADLARRQNLGSASESIRVPAVPPLAPAAGAARPNDAPFNDDQRAVMAWTDRQFRSFFDARTFEGSSDAERAALLTKLVETLKGPQNREYYEAINTLAALRSRQAVQPLLAIAADHAEKDCRDRWMAIRALGMIGDKTVVPELVHLVYHGNSNTRWWAQISLVRLTGQNFGSDWQAWGQWWNQQAGQPPFKPDIVRWWKDQPEPDKLAETLAPFDRKFLDGIRGQAPRGRSSAAEKPPTAEAT